MIRWIGFPARLVVFAIALVFAILVYGPEKLGKYWYSYRKDWHRWVLQDTEWRAEEMR